jgi:hypothetical protein
MEAKRKFEKEKLLIEHWFNLAHANSLEGQGVYLFLLVPDHLYFSKIVAKMRNRICEHYTPTDSSSKISSLFNQFTSV